jgi:hypothetical protein
MRVIVPCAVEVVPVMAGFASCETSVRDVHMLQGQEAECLAIDGYVELIYTGFCHDDDLADKHVADIVCKTALLCNLPIE